jgi:hypothetical protein
MNLYDYSFTFKRRDKQRDIVGFGSIEAQDENQAYDKVKEIAENNYQANLRIKENKLYQTQVNLNIETRFVCEMIHS